MRLPGTTIVESLTALALVGLVFGICLRIYIGYSTDPGLSSRLVAERILNQEMERVIESKHFVSERGEISGLEIEKLIEPYSSEAGLIHIQLSAIQDDKVFYSIHRIIVQP